MKFGNINSNFKKLKERWDEDPEELIRDALESGYNEDYEDAL